jgi:hypothetical protein
MIETLLSSAVLLSASAAVSAAAPPTGNGRAADSFKASLKTLYDNTGADSGTGILSTNFQTSFDTFDCAAADDFEVPKSRRWTIKEVDVTGNYGESVGPADSVDVAIYRNSHGHPGGLVARYDDLAYTDPLFGSFRIVIPKTRLGHGTYWVSVVANMNYFVTGDWQWEQAREVHGHPPQWQNPGDGFETGCTTWSEEAACADTAEGDHFFALKGRSG